MVIAGDRARSRQALVLVIEDDPILMMTLSDYVEEAGCEVIEATDVAEALAILSERTDIRLVVTDLDIRGSQPGLQLALSIRDRWPPIELLMVGSLPYRPSDLPQRGVLFGKPFDSRRIIAALRDMAA